MPLWRGHQSLAYNVLLYKELYSYMYSTRERLMDVISYTDARANLKDVMDRVVQDRTHVVVTRASPSPWLLLVGLSILAGVIHGPSGCSLA